MDKLGKMFDAKLAGKKTGFLPGLNIKQQSSSSPKKASKWGALRKNLDAGQFKKPADIYAEDGKELNDVDKVEKNLPGFL